MVVSRDVIFSKEEAWNWSSKEANKENVVSDESEDQLPGLTLPAPPSSPQLVTPSSMHISATFGSSSSSNESKGGIPPHIKIGSLSDVYEHLEEEEETNIFCLYANQEPLTFQEAIEEDCWRCPTT